MLFAISINHNTAPVALREKIAFSKSMLVDALQEAYHHLKLRELVILSTCNRTELYSYSTFGETPLMDWLERYHGLYPGTLRPHIRFYQGIAVAQHMMQVACGLDSMILGEPQITGQLKQSHIIARKAATIGPLLEKLFQYSFSVVKQVRTDTDIGKHPVSVAYAAVALARQIFTDIKDAKVLLLGAGETIELTTQHLIERGVTQITVANRTLEKAQQLAARFHAQARELSTIGAWLDQADIVIASTASSTPLLGKGMIESALKKRRHKPMLMIDLAIPRDIEAEVKSLEDVYLYTLDDLKDVIEDNLRHRQQSAQQAQTIITQQVLAFEQQLRALSAIDLVRRYRHNSLKIRDDALAKSLKQLNKGADPALTLHQLAHNLTNKIMHHPSIGLKQLGAQDDPEHLKLACQLLGLDHESL